MENLFGTFIGLISHRIHIYKLGLVWFTGSGKLDPYLEATLASQCQSTPVATSTVCPRWNASMQFFPNNLSEDVICLTVFGKDYFSPDGEDYLFEKMEVIFLRFELPWIACMVWLVCRVCCISTLFKICVGPFSNIRWDISKKSWPLSREDASFFIYILFFYYFRISGPDRD